MRPGVVVREGAAPAWAIRVDATRFDAGDLAAAPLRATPSLWIDGSLEGAIERREPWGVWGGQLFLNGKILASKRRRGRPPKIARSSSGSSVFSAR